MADFDANGISPEEVLRQQIQQLQFTNQQLHHQAQQAQAQAQFFMGHQNQNFQNQFYQDQQLAPRPNLNLPPPREFNGDPSELKTFRIKLVQFLRGNGNTFFDDQSQVMYAGSLLQGPAQQWLETLIDPVTVNLPDHYTLDLFLDELTSFFGGAATIASRENDLDDLRQTGTVVQFAVAFQTIINTFNPRWTDSAAIYVFSRKIKEQIRYLVAGKGNVPTTFQAYIAAAVAMEANLAAGKHRNPPQQQQQPQRQQNPNPNPGRQPPPPAQNPADGARPMEVDGSRGVRGPLTMDERRRRSDHNLCAYCGQPGHLIATCPGAARGR